jgi:hypothetical protein
MNRHFYFLTKKLIVVVTSLSGAILTGCEITEVTKTTFSKTKSIASRSGSRAREQTKRSSTNPLAGT